MVSPLSGVYIEKNVKPHMRHIALRILYAAYRQAGNMEQFLRIRNNNNKNMNSMEKTSIKSNYLFTHSVVHSVSQSLSVVHFHPIQLNPKEEVFHSKLFKTHFIMGNKFCMRLVLKCLNV